MRQKYFIIVILSFVVVVFLAFLITKEINGQNVKLGPESEQKIEEINPFEAQRISANGVSTPPGYEPSEGGIAGDNAPRFMWEAHALEGYGTSSTFTQPKVTDLDNDGEKEVISALLSADSTSNCHNVINQGVYAWDSSGNLKQGFPVYLNRLDTPALCGYLSIVGVGDVTGDKNLEIVVATGRNLYQNVTPNKGGVYVISSDGQILREIRTDKGFSGVDHQQAVLFDLDNDGKMEIIAKDYASPVNDANDGRRLYVWRGDGTNFPGWPVVFSAPGYVFIQPAAFVSSREKNIVINIAGYGQFGIAKLNTEGILEWRIDTPAPLPPVIADIDRNGNSEIIVKTSTPDYQREIFILNQDGEIINRFPINIEWSYGSEISVGDLNLDGNMEIVYHDAKKVYISDIEGNLLDGFPRFIWDEEHPYQNNGCANVEPPPYCYLTDMGIADIDGDRFPDIYGIAVNMYRTSGQGDHAYAIFAFDRFGNTLNGFPFPLMNYQEMSNRASWIEKYSPTIADINNDGYLDIVTSKGYGRIEAVATITPFNDETSFFPQYGVNERNTRVVKSLNEIQ